MKSFTVWPRIACAWNGLTTLCSQQRWCTMPISSWCPNATPTGRAAHFFAVASQLMRRILVDYARGRLRAKRGRKQSRLPLEKIFVISKGRCDELLALDEALERLGKLDGWQSRVVELRFFGGLSVEETAKILGVCPKTVKREWSFAKAWLYGALKERHGPDARTMGKNKSAV